MAQTAHRIVRVTVNGHIGGHQIANVFHQYADENVAGEGRDGAIDFAVKAVRGAWQASMLDGVTSAYIFDGIDWVDLDSADGQTGHMGPDPELPTQGTQGGAGAPPAVSILIRKNTDGGRQSRRGRIFVASPDETWIDASGTLLEARQTTWQAIADEFLDTCNDSSNEGFNENCHMVTVTWPTITVNGRKRPDPNGVGTAHTVTSLTVAPNVATQRRRQRR